MNKRCLMEVPRSEWCDVSQRLNRLKLRHRRLKRLVATSVLFIVAVLLTVQRPVPRPLAQDQQVESKITVRQFSLVDDNGVEPASLVADGAGSVFLVLFDRNAKTRAALFVVNNLGPSLGFYDSDGQTRSVVGSTALVASHVADTGGQTERNPPSSIVLSDKDGELL
jgi:hypothetical protein